MGHERKRKTKKKRNKKLNESRFHETKSHCAVLFRMDALCAWSLPKRLQFLSVTGINSFVKRFTEAHRS